MKFNDLNSAIIEGKVCSQPTLFPTASGKQYCKFDVSVFRNGTTTKFEVRTLSSIAVSCLNFIENNDRLRIVGSLCKNAKNEVYIEAEHVELERLKMEIYND